MKLFQRISDIIAANFNDIAESWEDPEKMLRQAIREMDQSIQEATQETAKVMASQKVLAKQSAYNQQELSAWQHKAERAVHAGDDELARKALSRKREHEKLVIALQDQLQATEEASRTLKNQLAGMQARLSEAKRNLATLVARKRAADFRKKMHSMPGLLDSPLDDKNAFAKFDRLQARVEQAEAEADALAELRATDSSGTFHTEECQELTNDFDEELLKLKAQLGR